MLRRPLSVLLLIGMERAVASAAAAVGYVVLSVPTGRGAWAVLGDMVPPTVVVAAAALPDGRGLAVWEALRRDYTLRAVHVLLVGVLTEQEQWRVLADPWAYAVRGIDDPVFVSWLHPTLASSSR